MSALAHCTSHRQYLISSTSRIIVCLGPRESFSLRRYNQLFQCPLSPMAPHLSPVELNLIMECLGRRQSLKDIHEVIKLEREAGGIEPPKIWAIRRACRGATHRRGRAETRGGKYRLNEAQVRRLNNTRIRLPKKAKVQYEVPYHKLLKSARLKVHRTTAARHLKKQYGVKWRRLREKPPRSKHHVDERKEVCRLWKKKPK